MNVLSLENNIHFLVITTKNNWNSGKLLKKTHTHMFLRWSAKSEPFCRFDDTRKWLSIFLPQYCGDFKKRICLLDNVFWNIYRIMRCLGFALSEGRGTLRECGDDTGWPWRECYESWVMGILGPLYCFFYF